MDAVKYLEARGRMCSTITNCNKCPMNAANNGTNADCADFQRNYPKKAVDVIEKWLIIHPVKSYLDVFKEAMKEKFGSNIKDGVSITRSICRDKAIYGCSCRHEQPVSQIDCIDCWYSECKLPIKGE